MKATMAKIALLTMTIFVLTQILLTGTLFAAESYWERTLRRIEGGKPRVMEASPEGFSDITTKSVEKIQDLEKAKDELSLTRGLDKNILQADFSLLEADEELVLLRTLMQFNTCLKMCCDALEPQGLTAYLQDLAADFHKFYDLHRVISEKKELALARLGLCSAVKTVLSNGLNIIGVSCPEEM